MKSLSNKLEKRSGYEDIKIQYDGYTRCSSGSKSNINKNINEKRSGDNMISEDDFLIDELYFKLGELLEEKPKSKTCSLCTFENDDPSIEKCVLCETSFEIKEELSKDVVNNKAKEYVILKNDSTRCYMNTILQLMHRINPDDNEIISEPYISIFNDTDNKKFLTNVKKEFDNSDLDQRENLYHNLGKFFLNVINFNYKNNNKTYVDLEVLFEVSQYILNKISGAYNSQQDVREFMDIFFKIILLRYCSITYSKLYHISFYSGSGCKNIQDCYDNSDNDQKIEIIKDNLLFYIHRFDEKGNKLNNKVYINKTLKIKDSEFKIDSCLYHKGDDQKEGHYMILIYDDGKPSCIIDDLKYSKKGKEITYDINYEDIQENSYLLLYKKVKLDGRKRKKSTRKILKSRRKKSNRRIIKSRRKKSTRKILKSRRKKSTRKILNK